MRSRFRTSFLLTFVACHVFVLSAGPSLHGLLSLDHDAASTSASERGGGTSHGAGHGAHDCAACHFLSLAQHNPDSVVAFFAPQTGRAFVPVNRLAPPDDRRSDRPARAPPRASFDA